MASPGDLFGPTLLIITAISLLLLAVRYLRFEMQKSSLLISASLILFFSTGYIRDTAPSELIPGIRWYVLLVPAGIVFALVAIALVRYRGNLDNVIKIATFIGVVLVAGSVIGICSGSTAGSPSSSPGLSPVSSSDISGASGFSGDIYYLILDGYTSFHALRTYYDMDTTGFETYLRDEGFSIANESAGNYYKTKLTIPASMNMEYLGTITTTPYIDAMPFESLAIKKFRYNEIARFLKSQGYTIVFLRSGYFLTNQMEDADIILNPGVQSTYEKAFVEKTVLWPLFNLFPQTSDLSKNRRTIEDTFAALESAPALPGKKFVFAHILVPHEPYLFGPTGGRPANASRYKEGYRDQVVYVNSRLEKIIDKILSGSETPPIIVIQGDHGPRYLLADERYMDESLQILNACLLPDGGGESLYSNVTPVNTFRIIFDRYFHSNLGLCEDVSYFNSVGYTFADGEFHCLTGNLTGWPNFSYCKGWAEPNVKLKTGFRWMTNNGTILVYSPGNDTVRFGFRAITDGKERHLRIIVNEHPAGETVVTSVPANESFSISLAEGINSIRMFVPDGDFITPTAGAKRQYYNMGFDGLSFTAAN